MRAYVLNIVVFHTLFVRSSLLLAEQERLGGVAQHLSPFAGVGDIGNLLTRAGFAIPTVDIERFDMVYSNMFELLRDLRGMGETNCTWRRGIYIRCCLFVVLKKTWKVHSIDRRTLVAAASIYDTMYRCNMPIHNPDDSSIESKVMGVYVSVNFF